VTQTQVDLIVGAVEIVCLIVCFLKWKFWTVILTIVGTVVMAIGPLITGNYIANVLSPFVTHSPDLSRGGRNGSIGDLWAVIGSSCSPARNWQGRWLDSRNRR
jgi:hypothetical protein